MGKKNVGLELGGVAVERRPHQESQDEEAECEPDSDAGGNESGDEE